MCDKSSYLSTVWTVLGKWRRFTQSMRRKEEPPHQVPTCINAVEENNDEPIRHIVLIGAIANPNVGDEAILYHTLSHIDKVFGRNASVHVLSQNAQYTEQFLGLHSCRASASDALRALTARHPDDLDALMVTEANVLNRLRGADCFRRTNARTLALYDEVIAQFDNVDVLHVIGGGYMNSMWPHMLFETHVATRIAKERGARVVLSGQSIAPFDVENPTHSRLLADIASSADCFDFRDDSIQSARQLTSASHLMRTVDDLAIHVEHRSAGPTDEGEAYGNITLVGLLGPATAEEHYRAHKHVFDALKEFLHGQFQEERVQYVNLLSFSPGDERLLGELVDCAPAKVRIVTLYDRPSSEALDIVQSAQWNVGERFHHAVFSMAAGVPSLSWWHNDYYANKFISAYGTWHLEHSNLCMPQDQVTAKKLMSFASTQSLHDIERSLSTSKESVYRLYELKSEAIRRTYDA